MQFATTSKDGQQVWKSWKRKKKKKKDGGKGGDGGGEGGGGGEGDGGQHSAQASGAAEGNVGRGRRFSFSTNMENKYSIGKFLGKGHFAVVHLAKNRETGEEVAIKTVTLTSKNEETIKKEVSILERVAKHPSIVHLYNVYITKDKVCMVMELCEGGELFGRLVRSGPYTERSGQVHMRQVAEALQFLHQNNIIHRDLKPENLLLKNKDDDSDLRVADFGLSLVVEENDFSKLYVAHGHTARPKSVVEGGGTMSPRICTPSASLSSWSSPHTTPLILSVAHRKTQCSGARYATIGTLKMRHGTTFHEMRKTSFQN